MRLLLDVHRAGSQASGEDQPHELVRPTERCAQGYAHLSPNVVRDAVRTLDGPAPDLAPDSWAKTGQKDGSGLALVD
jgi:hypothetical protein